MSTPAPAVTPKTVKTDAPAMAPPPPDRTSQAAQARKQEASAPPPQKKAGVPMRTDDKLTHSAEAVDVHEGNSNSNGHLDAVSQNFWGAPETMAHKMDVPPKPAAPPTVTIEPWGSGKNDSVWNALNTGGYTDQQIVDQKLVDQVAQQNKLEDPNVVHSGQKLQLPLPPQPAPPEAEVPPTPPPEKCDDAVPTPQNPGDPKAIERQQNAAAFNRNFTSFDGAGDHGRIDGQVSRNDLEAIAAGQVKANDETRAAAEYYLNNPEALRQLDNSNAANQVGRGDDIIKRADAEKYLNSANERLRTEGRTKEELAVYDVQQTVEYAGALQTLEQRFNQTAGQDGHFTREELKTLARDSSDAQVRASAQYLFDHPDKLAQVDAADDPHRKADDTFTLGDIQRAQVNLYEQTLAELSKYLEGMGG